MEIYLIKAQNEIYLRSENHKLSFDDLYNFRSIFMYQGVTLSLVTKGNFCSESRLFSVKYPNS